MKESFALLRLLLAASCSSGEPKFYKILNPSAEHHIPQGQIPNMTLNLTEITKRLIVEQDALRSSSLTHAHIEYFDIRFFV